MYYTLSLSILSALLVHASADASLSFDDIMLQMRTSIDKTVTDDCIDAHTVSFEDYIQKHKRTYAAGSKEYQEREALFDQRHEEALSHNCGHPKRSWQQAINHLSDRTDFELAKLRGRKGVNPPGHPTSGGGAFAMERLAALESADAVVGKREESGPLGARASALRNVPESFSWTGKLKSMGEALNQGGCGSCWASATKKMLEAHAEIYHSPKQFALQQIVSCTPNPQDCGGNGGCNGSTGELALDYVMHNGLGEDSDFPYKAKDIACPTNLVAKNGNPVPQPTASSFLAIRTRSLPQFQTSPAQSFGMMGWNRLPINKLEPLFKALYQEGPVAVSVVAGRSWNSYGEGIMNNCTDKHQIVNHLVVLAGYGEDSSAKQSPLPDSSEHSTKYWEILNSWGNDWGENGHIRLIRQDDAAEEKVCGWNEHPEVGTGCKGDPAKVWVCGSCGILYDNVVPHFHGSTPLALKLMQRRKGGGNGDEADHDAGDEAGGDDDLAETPDDTDDELKELDDEYKSDPPVDE